MRNSLSTLSKRSFEAKLRDPLPRLPYVFSAKGAGSCKPGATPRGKVSPQKRALKSRIKATSIPHIAFVEFDAVFAQKLAILLLKTMGAMVFFLTLHVFENGIKLTWAH
jgi:hypothetical protein